MNVGEKIKNFRLKSTMTQEELGKYLGVGKAAVQKYESGQVQNLKSAHIKKLCELFNAKPWDFIFDDEDEFISKRSNFERETYKIVMMIEKLNDIGRNRIIEYICDLNKIDEYRR